MRKRRYRPPEYLWGDLPGSSSPASAPSKHERKEHAGRVPQVGVHSGPRQTVAPEAGSPADEAGLPVAPSHGTPPGRVHAEPANSYSPSNPSSSYYPQELIDLLTPGPTAKEIAESAARLGVKPKDTGIIDQVGNAVDTVAEDFSKGARAAIQETQKLAKLPEQVPKQQVDSFLGQKTLGTPTIGQLAGAALRGQVRTNRRGKVTVPETRKAARTLSQLRAKKARIAGPLPGLDSEQQQIIRTVLKVGDRMGATDKEKLAAVETALVESNARNLQYGDADSQGWRQERTSQYGDGPTGANNVKAGAQRFFEESVSDTGGTRGAGMTPGELAQTIQGSAFPERYDEVAGVAQPILAAYMKGGKPSPRLAAAIQGAQQRAQQLGIPTKQASPEQQELNYLKVFGQQVGQQLKLVKAGKLDAGKGTLIAGDSDIEYGHEPEIAARLKLLSAKLGIPIYIISGHRTPQHSVEVGGFADDPHTEGQAADIGIGSEMRDSAGSITEAQYNSVGLHRPYYPESAAEINHVELLNGGTPVTGSGGAGVGGATAVGGGVVEGAGIGGSAASQQKKQQVAAPISLGSILTPGAASAALPAAYQKLQEGATPEAPEGGELGGIIESILRRRRA